MDSELDIAHLTSNSCLFSGYSLSILLTQYFHHLRLVGCFPCPAFWPTFLVLYIMSLCLIV